MNFFRNYTFSWIQIGILKISLLSIGVIAGNYWYEFFNANLILVVTVAVIATTYAVYVAMKQW